MASKFQIVSVDGDDYRHRPVDGHTLALTDSELQSVSKRLIADGKTVALDEFDKLLAHLAKVHPSKYLKLISSIDALLISSAHVLSDQSAALRFVSFVDRLYESRISLASTGIGLTEVFLAEHLAGGYRKKYLRAISRIGSLTELV
jgi:cell division protein ZapE